MVASSFAFLAIVMIVGFSAISIERQKGREIGRRIISHEREIKQLRRDNEELSVKIAEQISPMYLTRRASSRLARPQITAIVWGHENYDGGRVDFSGRSKGLVSFKAPIKRNESQQ